MTGYDSLKEIVKVSIMDLIAPESKDKILALLQCKEQNPADPLRKLNIKLSGKMGR